MKTFSILVLSTFMAATAPASGTVLDTVSRPTPVTAGGSFQAWSRWNPATRNWSLVVHNNNTGRTYVAPVAPKKRPFDADAGLGAHSGAIVVYTRCRPGCDVYRYDVVSRTETMLRGISSPRHDESSPSVSQGLVAAIRDGKTAYVHSLGYRTPSTRIRTPASGLQTIDIYGGHAVGIGATRGSAPYKQTVWSMDLYGRKPPVRVGGVGDGETRNTISSAQVAQGGIRWVQQGSEVGGFEGFRGTRYDGSERIEATWRPPSTYSASFYASRVLFVRTTRLDRNDQYTRCAPSGCKIETAPAPRFIER